MRFTAKAGFFTSFLPWERHTVCCLTLWSVYVEEAYESNQYKASEPHSNLIIQAKSKCKIPIARSPQGRGACVGGGPRDVVEKGARQEAGRGWQAGNMYLRYVLWCLRKQFCLAKRSEL